MVHPLQPIDPALLALLRCPQTGEPLRVASGEEVESLNAQIRVGTLTDASGEPVPEPLQGGLVSQGGDWLYPIRDAIPTLIPEEAVPLRR